MLFNRLTEDELERAVYIDPTNTDAQAEMLRRVPELMGERSDELRDHGMELENVRKDHVDEIEELEATIAQLEDEATTAGTTEAANADTIADLEARVAELTFAEDLV